MVFIVSFFVQSLLLKIQLTRPQCLPLPLEFRFTINESNKPDFIIFDGDIAVHNYNPDLYPHKFSRTSENKTIERYREQEDQNLKHANLWPNGIIPFVLHDSLSKSLTRTISSAIKHWEEETCIRFRQKVDQDKYWITFRSDSTGCYSFLGRDESCQRQGQPVSLSKGCDSFLVAAHEIGHVVGLIHQHNRNDRDDFVNIIWKNLDSKNDNYFRKEFFDTFGIPYDYTSLMHYNQWHISSDIMNKSAMVTHNPFYQRFMGIRSGLSFRDKKLVNLIYNCSQGCPSSNNCMNEGFLSSNCSCICPPNTSGSLCEKIIVEDYYEALDPLNCGGFVREEGALIQTPLTRQERLNCVWMIESPNSNQVVRLSIEEFSFHRRSDINTKIMSPPDFKCANESLEIRLSDPYDGRFFCGNDLVPGSSLTSSSSHMILLISSSIPFSTSTFKAKVYFEDKNVASTTTSSPKGTSATSNDVNPFVSLIRLPLDSLIKLVVNTRDVFINTLRNG